MSAPARGRRRAFLLAVSIALIAGCSTAPTPTPAGSATPEATATATATATASPAALTRDEAVALARKATTRFANEDVLEARLGTWGVVDLPTPPDAPPTPAPETRVWIVNLGYRIRPLDGQGVIVVLDAVDGRVLNATDWIS